MTHNLGDDPCSLPSGQPTDAIRILSIAEASCTDCIVKLELTHFMCLPLTEHTPITPNHAPL